MSHAHFSKTVLLNKMAAANLGFSCNYDHIPVELASTEQFTIMCRLHTPVHLFTSSRDMAFEKWHYGVSVINFFLSEKLKTGYLK